MSHIKQTIQDLTQRIAELCLAKTILEKMDSPVESMRLTVERGTADLVAPFAIPSPKPASPKPAPKPVTKPNGKRVGRPAGTALLATAKHVKGLREPFRTSDVATAAGLDQKTASNWITQAKNKGWLKRVGMGEYQRTPAFAIASASESSVNLLNEIHSEIESAKPQGD